MFCSWLLRTNKFYTYYIQLVAPQLLMSTHLLIDRLLVLVGSNGLLVGQRLGLRLEQGLGLGLDLSEGGEGLLVLIGRWLLVTVVDLLLHGLARSQQGG